MTAAVRPDPEAVLAFWFRREGEAAPLVAQPQWFAKDKGFDASIRDRFGSLIEAALADGLPSWGESPHGILARILVLDQFTRNAFRDMPKAFAGDAAARALAGSLVESGGDALLEPLERVFVYLPFEHSELLADQDRAVSLFGDLEHLGAGFASYLDYARRHREVILQFGRFPHRNRILGRASSSAELAFLTKPGSGF